MTTLSRRRFMQLGAAAGMAYTLGASGAESTPVRLGFVGVGNRGAHLLRTVLELPHVEVNAVCDIIPERAAEAQATTEKKTGNVPEAYTKGEKDYERLVERDDLDAVICATPWKWHTPVTVAAMRSGKYGATEVPAAVTLEECWELVRTSEETGMPCMMLENVCYFQNALTLLRMVREGVFGELIHAEAGYQHDCRSYQFTDDGQLTWRGEYSAALNGNLYPTHPIGPIAQWFNINRGDRFTKITSMSSAALGMKAYAREKFGADHPLAQRDYALGDVNTCLIQTTKGRTITLYYDTLTPRPYDLVLRLQGTKGIHIGWKDDNIYIEGASPVAHEYESFAPYQEQYAHPLWTQLEEAAKATGGHGGADYITLYDFIKAVRNKTQPPQDVYDAATWSAILPLSIASVAQDNAALSFPDFTQGRWKATPPVPIYGA